MPPDARHVRLVICGVPRAGKTTLAGQLVLPVRHTDDLIGEHAWGDDSAEVARWMAEQGPWAIEGVAAVRALRKALQGSRDAKPCDEVIYLRAPRQKLSRGQAAMAKGVETVFSEILPELRRRGVRIEIR